MMGAISDVAVVDREGSVKTGAPDWGHVPFEVGCARCGHDLRGLTEAKCPACGLEFDWAEAVPIEQLKCQGCGYHLYGLPETRCPECGEEFTWQQVLDEYRRRKKPLFEYHWRSAPVRSFISTCRLAVRPWRLWRTVDIHDPPDGRGLTVLLSVAVLLFFVTIPAFAFLDKWVIAEIWGLSGLGSRPSVLPGGFVVPYGSPLRRGISPWSSGLGWYGWWMMGVSIWAGAILAVLMIFRQSMRMCRVRNAHVMRVYIHAWVPAPVGMTLACMMFFAADLAEAISPRWVPTPVDEVVLIAVLLLVFFTWLCTFISIGLGYRCYIRMKHAWGVAITSQILAFLFLACVLNAPVIFARF